MSINRRDLLRYFISTSGCFVFGASLNALSGCSPEPALNSRFSFPQGVASADPQSDAVVLWTRVEGPSGGVDLTLQVSEDEGFSKVVISEQLTASADFDHTVRALITDLKSDHFYYYRFVDPDGGHSRTGRTRTAPAPDAERPLNMAVFSCQDYEQGYFTAYRRMIIDDQKAPAERQIDLVLHVGDFIYENVRGPETVGEPDLQGNQISLTNRDGTKRLCGPLPSGGVKNKRGWYLPTSLEDYRALYKTYLTDPDLQEARALYPFVQTWDDHELVNDYWQSYYKGKSIADLKVAANKAWYEFIPAALSDGGRDVKNHAAKDFSPVTVENIQPSVFDDDYLSLEENNLAAIQSMTIYRSLKWGSMAELFLVDGRSYRGPRGLPQELLTIGRHPYPERPIDPELINIMNEGRTYNNGNPPEKITYLGQTIDNPRKDVPRGSMLGRAQKDWLKDGLVNSDVRWKLLGLNVGLMRHGFDDSYQETGDVNRILWTDGWDGYPAERRELSSFVRDEKLNNVVSLTGDRHAHMAGVVYDDFDKADPVSVIPEFAGGAVSAPNRLVIQKILLEHDPALEKLAWFDGDQFGYDQKIMPSLNAWLLGGAKAAASVHNTGSDAEFAEQIDPKVNPHLNYMDADAYGYFTAHFTAQSCEVEFVSVEEPINPNGLAEPAIRRRIYFSVDAWEAGTQPDLELVKTEGEKPLGGLKK